MEQKFHNETLNIKDIRKVGVKNEKSSGNPCRSTHTYTHTGSLEKTKIIKLNKGSNIDL